jgi:hypothetical protein
MCDLHMRSEMSMGTLKIHYMILNGNKVPSYMPYHSSNTDLKIIADHFFILIICYFYTVYSYLLLILKSCPFHSFCLTLSLSHIDFSNQFRRWIPPKCHILSDCSLMQHHACFLCLYSQCSLQLRKHCHLCL